MQLNDYYAPLNFINFFVFTLFFLSMDVIGNYWATLLKFPNFLRSVHWTFGLGLFIFAWFLLHFYLPFQQSYIILSIVVLVSPFVPYYIKNKGIVSLVKVFWEFPFPLIFLLAIAQKIFFLVSLPPYVNDELAYHYVSPAELITRTGWDFNHNINFYYMIPKTLETAFTLMFSLTQTYAAARLLHFMIFFTSIYAITYFLKERVNVVVAIAYSFFILFLFAIPLVDSTRGYIDVAPAILSNLMLVTIIGWLLTKQRGYFYSVVFLTGFMVGIKYTVLGYISASVFFVIVLFIFLVNKKIKLYFNIKFLKTYLKRYLSIIIISMVLFILMGGYWYIKNFIVTNNPIYPFAFRCKNNIPCGSTNAFFSNYGTQFKIENIPVFMRTVKDTLK